jgi:hypothetical protein
MAYSVRLVNGRVSGMKAELVVGNKSWNIDIIV